MVARVRELRERHIAQGDLWWVEFDPFVGHEQAGRRPALIVSTDEFHKSAFGLVVVMPLTTQDHGYPTHVLLPGDTPGLRERSYVQAEQIWTVNTLRVHRRLGEIDPVSFNKVLHALSTILGL